MASNGKNLSSFAIDLYEKCGEEKAGNTIMSPYSVAIALGLASIGSNGATFDQIKRALYLTGDKNTIAENFSNSSNSLKKKSGKAVLGIANKVYVKSGYELKPQFEQIAVKKFNSEVQSINFDDSAESINTINRWVATKTNDKIKELMSSDSVNQDTGLVLVNAIYFKGLWENPFDKEFSCKKEFWCDENKSVETEYMFADDKSFNYGKIDELDCSALEMKYEESDISFCILLPNKKTGLSELVSKLKSYDLKKVSEKMKQEIVDVLIPKFKVEFEIELNDVLKKLGIVDLFSDGANLSDLLLSPEPLKVSKVVHKAFIEVNEAGTEAAAVTGMGIMLCCLRYNDKFTADHPFIYFIRNSDEILFTGRFCEPAE